MERGSGPCGWHDRIDTLLRNLFHALGGSLSHSCIQTSVTLTQRHVLEQVGAWILSGAQWWMCLFPISYCLHT